ncbi:histidine kinase [Catenulispora acidiphila DSM 44928]|uniref:histidine kinase n=1 Tax=Catenulispora acidiphila (strain DSM 44928 / JCM 14897 / NBRC 102108 / NRRL B-24433 / ID139908) TaxID=479433 RepID=C7QGM7_CATAD|nr:sensor histidine kinase [Catenulispora acidiphila]ACU74907.1 histidine kinase [Catenulispora acidiphila DSM 44928]
MTDQPPQPPSRPWLAWLWVERSTVGLPLIVLVIDVFGTWGAYGHWHNQGGSTQVDVRPLDWFAWLLVVAGPIALWHRRKAPRVAFAVCLGATLLYLLMGYATGPIYLNALLAVIVIGGTGYRREVWAGSLLFAIGMIFVPTHAHVGEKRNSPADILFTAGWLLALLMLAELFGLLRQRALEAQKARDQEARAREQESRRQASEERLEIARELHDVLAHSISLIAVQANVALEVMDRRPEQARIALSAIKDASRSALGEVRSVLTVLRGDRAAPRDPAPDLGRLGHLVELAEAAGLKVALSVVGDLEAVPLAVSQAGYRIIQESLTNVVRHAAAGRATILVEAAGGLHLRIADDGRGCPLGEPGAGGNGLPGMRERATAFGGTLTAGPQSGGGFRVDAHIPFGALLGNAGSNADGNADADAVIVTDTAPTLTPTAEDHAEEPT